jgi:acyl-CoA reductase-like NAD-dependent aldehyde dehydrogenase
MNQMTPIRVTTPQRMAEVLAAQKAANIRDGAPGLEARIGRLDRCIGLLVGHEAEIVQALTADYGARAAAVSGITDIGASIGPLKHARRHLKAWMKPEPRKTTPALLGLFGAKAEVRFQPKGVVGIVSPWNFPVNLTFAPLAGVLAAGNRAMIKPSEFTPATSELMARMFAEVFDEDEIAVFPGGPEIGEAFSALAFDHLVFTGATAIARHVMKAAAANLVPLTLELGGKSPVILGRSADYATSAARVMAGKTLNAGQICLAPDYVMAPADQLGAFVREATAAVTAMFPTIKDNPDYTAVIAERHFERIKGYVDDARAKGAEIVEINPAGEDFSQQGASQDPADPDPQSNGRDEGDAGRDLRARPPRDDLSQHRRGDRLCERPRPAAGTLLLRRRRHGGGQGPGPDHVRRRDGQRRDLPRGDGGPALRRRRSLRHGQLSRRRRVPRVQPPQVGLPPAQEGPGADEGAAPALWRGREEIPGGPAQTLSSLARPKP